MKKAIVLWSGGKDCHLALAKARKEGFDVIGLATFSSPETQFKAHPKEWMSLQAKALELPHMHFVIHEPFAENYEFRLKKLKEETGVSVIVTGDISTVHSGTNWIAERVEAAEMNVFQPLWGQDRRTVFQDFIDWGFKAVLSCVKQPWLTDQFLGRTLDSQLLEEFKVLSKINDLDLCGENGEFHTMVLDGPGYKAPIKLLEYKAAAEDELCYFSGLSLRLEEDLPSLALERKKTCEQCGTDFGCYTAGCWCAELPMIMPLDTKTKDCLCPECLKAIINDKLAEQGMDQL